MALSGDSSGPIHRVVYWDIRGLAQAIRLSLVFAAARGEANALKFVDERLDAGEPGSSSYKQSWLKTKFERGIEFPNLPYVHIVSAGGKEERRVSQSLAILRWIGRSCSLQGEAWRTDLVLDQLRDINSRAVGKAYRGFDDVEQMKVWATETLPRDLSQLQRFLGSRSFFASEAAPTIADFLAVEVIAHACELANAASCPVGLESRFKVLANFVRRMAGLPGVREYTRKGGEFESSGLCYRCNNPHAKWSGPGPKRRAFLSSKLTEGVGLLSALLDGEPDERYAAAGNGNGNNGKTKAAPKSTIPCPSSLLSSPSFRVGLAVGAVVGAAAVAVAVAVGLARDRKFSGDQIQ